MDYVDALAVAPATRPKSTVKILTWGVITLLALALAVQVGLGSKLVVTAGNPQTPNFAFGPIPGSVTQSIAFPGGPLESMSVWTRTSGSRPQQAEAHVLQSSDDKTIRSARFHARPGAELRPTAIAFEPIDLPSGPLQVRIVVPKDTRAQIHVGATLDDAYKGGRLVDASGHATPGVDLAFSMTGKAGPLTRLQAQARHAPRFLAVGVAAALLLGSTVGSAVWSSLQGQQFRRLAAVSVSCGIAAAVFIALLHGPDALI